MATVSVYCVPGPVVRVLPFQTHVRSSLTFVCLGLLSTHLRCLFSIINVESRGNFLTVQWLGLRQCSQKEKKKKGKKAKKASIFEKTGKDRAKIISGGWLRSWPFLSCRVLSLILWRKVPKWGKEVDTHIQSFTAVGAITVLWKPNLVEGKGHWGCSSAQRRRREPVTCQVFGDLVLLQERYMPHT